MLNWVLEGSVIKYELEISIDLYNILFIVLIVNLIFFFWS